MRAAGAVVGVLLVVAAVLAIANPFRWIGLGDLSWQPVAIAAVGFAVLAVVAIRPGAWAPPWFAPVAVSVLTLFSAVTVWLVVLGAMFADTEKIRVVDVSADGRFRLLVHDTSNVIDPVKALYVESTEGWFGRRTFLGCRNSDTTVGWIDSARFGGPDTVVVEAERRWTLRFDPEDVRAIDTLSDDQCLPGLYTG